MKINKVNACPEKLYLCDMKVGDLFERECESPKAVYLVTGLHRDLIEAEITREANRSSATRDLRGAAHRRHLDSSIGWVHQVVSLSFNQIMPAGHFEGRPLRRLHGELDVSEGTCEN